MTGMKTKIILNPDPAIVEEVRRLVKENDGYCPCALVKDTNTKCMCKDFRDKISDENFSGECHCGLYIKVEE